MGRKQSSEAGKREEILAAAQELFLEKGFDGTSVRSIMKKAGGEVGLFYYYFKSKDEAFDCMLDRFFSGYEADFTRIVAHGQRNPCRLMEVFFEYVETATSEFRLRYAPKMHRTVRWAIREHTMEIIEPYLRQIVAIQSAYYEVPPAIEPDAAALYLTYGVCSSILHEETQLYQERRRGVKRGVSLLMGMPMEEQELRIPFPASEADLPGWISLLDAVDGGASGLDREAYRLQLARRITAGEGWVIRCQDELAAALLYSRERCELDFLAVRPAYRRRGLAGRLVETAAAQFPVGTELLASPGWGGGPAGADMSAFFQALGFTGGDASDPRLRLTVKDRPPVPHRSNTATE